MRPEPDPPGPGQESVWDFPRPAVAEPVASHVLILHGGVIVAETRAAVRTLETSHPNHSLGLEVREGEGWRRGRITEPGRARRCTVGGRPAPKTQKTRSLRKP